MAGGTIRGLGLLLQVLDKACKLIFVFGPTIRFFVPAPYLTDYDAALVAIVAQCAVLKAIDYTGDLSHPG